MISFLVSALALLAALFGSAVLVDERKPGTDEAAYGQRAIQRDPLGHVP